MREIDELYADSGEPEEKRGVTRGTALKVGGLGLAGALAAFMPGRARAGVKRHASNSSCQGTGFECIGSNKAKACGYDNYSLGTCLCGTVFYGKLKPKGAPVGACIENVFCESLTLGDVCSGPRDCGSGFVCITGGCCTLRHKGITYKNFCMHYCEQGSQGAKLNMPKTVAHR